MHPRQRNIEKRCLEPLQSGKPLLGSTRFTERGEFMSVTTSLRVGSVAALLGCVAVTPLATAQPIEHGDLAAPTVVASDVPTTVVGIESIPSGLVVTGHRGTRVQVRTSGEHPRTIKPRNASTPARFTQLTPGRTYRVGIDGREVTTTRVLRAPGRVDSLVARTTSDATSVLITWEYTPRPHTGAVHFTVSAAASAGHHYTDAVSVDAPSSAREIVITGLDPHALYTFTVTPANSAATGKQVNAAMTKPLAALTATAADNPAGEDR